MIPRPARRAALGVLVMVVLLGATAAPVAADAPRPTDYRSTITDISPALPPGAALRIVGGDSLLELTVPAGHTAEVADYSASADADPVPYLRFDADGTVRRNARAVATTANEARYGTTDRAPDPDAAPRWETVATDGTYAWHDHRIHWMSPTPPRVVDADGRVDLGGPDGAWTVPLTIDGNPTVVTGQLVVASPPSLLAWGLLAVVSLFVTVLVGLRWGLRAATGLGAAAGAAAVIAALATWRAVPPGAGASIVPVVVAAVALLAGLVGSLGPRRLRPVGAAATAAALLGWGVTRWTVLTRAVLPTTLAPAIDRGTTAVALGVGLALAGLLVASPAAGRPPARGATAPTPPA